MSIFNQEEPIGVLDVKDMQQHILRTICESGVCRIHAEVDYERLGVHGSIWYKTQRATLSYNVREFSFYPENKVEYTMMIGTFDKWIDDIICTYNNRSSTTSPGPR